MFLRDAIDASADETVEVMTLAFTGRFAVPILVPLPERMLLALCALEERQAHELAESRRQLAQAT